MNIITNEHLTGELPDHRLSEAARRVLDEKYRSTVHVRERAVHVPDSTQTQRTVNIGAEKWLNQQVPVLDHGYIKLVDYMGNDCTICRAARVSYDRTGVIKAEWEDQRLINFLMRERHTSPFEHCILTFECKMPIFVAREWVRHRTARLNEVSARYTQLPREVYTPVPQRVQAQSKTNKQGSAGLGTLPTEVISEFLDEYGVVTDAAHSAYESALEAGVARELARICLPLSTYTKWVWQMDLHNLLHFLKLRLAPNAQWEIRLYAEAISRVVKDAFPMTWDAFEEHVLKAKTLSRTEVALLKKVLDRAVPECDQEAADKLLTKLHT